jgi:hypothetical protein
MIFALLLGPACTTSTGTDAATDLPPTATITAPERFSSYYADEPIAFLATVIDTEDAAESLSVAWFDDQGNALDIDDQADAAGALEGSTTLVAGERTVTLEVTDSAGGKGTASVALSIRTANAAPTCAITAPEDAGHVPSGQAVTLSGTVIDPDVGAESLTASWSSDLQGIFEGGALAVDGTTSVEVPNLAFGTHVLTLTGTDEMGLSCIATIGFSVGNAPDVVLLEPADGTVINAGDYLVFSAQISDDGTAPTDLQVRWTSDRDGVFNSSAADASGSLAFSTDDLSRGTHAIELTVTDSDGLSTSVPFSVRVNDLPSEPVVRISPAEPGGGDDLVAEITTESTDLEGDEIAYSYAWRVDGIATSYRSATVPASATTKGQTWSVEVTPDDGYGEGPAGSDSVTVVNSAPVLASVTLSPDPAYEGDTLACTPGPASDVDGDTIYYAYTWYVNGARVSSTSGALSDDNWAHMDEVACVVAPADVEAMGAAVDSNAVIISNTPPTISGVGLLPSTPRAADTLVCASEGFADADGDAEATSYSWTVDGVSAGSGPSLEGAFVGGLLVECTASADDGYDAGNTLVASVTVENTPPVVGSVDLAPDGPTEADTLVCTPTDVVDDDGTTALLYAYAWTVDGTDIGLDQDSLDGEWFDKHQVIACAVAASDGTEWGASTGSDEVTAENSVPEILSFELSTDIPSNLEDIVVTVSTEDLDGDSVWLHYTWLVNGIDVGVDSDTLSTDEFQPNDEIQVVVTPDDGEGTGPSVSSDVMVVSNAAPVIDAISLSPSPAYESSTLLCAVVASDADGDEVTVSYAWEVNGAVIAAAGSTLDGSSFSKGDTVRCHATPDDGSLTGDTAASAEISVEDSVPVFMALSLSATTAYEDDVIECAAEATDDDGDSVSVTYAWYVSGVLSGVTGSTIDGADFSKGDTVSCRVTATAAGASTVADTETATIENTAPVIDSVDLGPTLAFESSNLACSPEASDADGDSLSYTYAWIVNGRTASDTDASLGGEGFNRDDEVYCQVSASDGTATSSTVASETITIQNTAPTNPTIAIFPSEPEYGVDDLVCQVTVDATDFDGDEISYDFSWTRDGVAFTGTTTSLYDNDTVPASGTAEGEEYTCSVTATDGTDESSTRTASATVLAPSYTIGFDSEYSYTGTENPDIIHAIPVTVSSDVDLYKLAKITKEDNGNTF